jgi:hypothetical protein
VNRSRRSGAAECSGPDRPKRPELLEVLDAITQEAVWFEGDATDDWDDPDGYDWENDEGLTSY